MNACPTTDQTQGVGVIALATVACAQHLCWRHSSRDTQVHIGILRGARAWAGGVRAVTHCPTDKDASPGWETLCSLPIWAVAGMEEVEMVAAGAAKAGAAGATGAGAAGAAGTAGAGGSD